MSDLDQLLTDIDVDVLTNDVASSDFLKRAKERGLYDMDNSKDRLTIFLPPNNALSPNNDDDFTVVWNRHVVSSCVRIEGSHAVLQVRTLANLSYAVYSEGGKFYVGGVEIKSYNDEHGACTLHWISESLPDVRFRNGELSKFPLLLMSLQKYELSLCPTSLDGTWHTSFVAFASRKLLYLAKQPVQADNPVIEFEVPSVQSREEVNFWVQLVSNRHGFPLVSWLRPQNLVIYPSFCGERNPEIVEFLPQKGRANQPMWISGTCFDPSLMRVTIGDQYAVVYSCSDTLVKCIIPAASSASECHVQVANGNVFTTAPKVFTYV